MPPPTSETRAVKAPTKRPQDLRALWVLLFVGLPALAGFAIIPINRLVMTGPATESVALLVEKIATAYCTKGGGVAAVDALRKESAALPEAQRADYDELFSRLAFRVEAGQFGVKKPAVCPALSKRRVALKLRGEYRKLTLTADLAFGALLILVVPAVFALGAFAAARKLADSTEPGPASPKIRDTFERIVWCRRYDRWLDEESRPLVWRRWAFLVYLGFGVNYLLSPAGVQGTIIGEIGAVNPIPGTPSHPFFITFYANAPVFVAGFAGFYLYAITTSVRRQLSGSLTSTMLPSLLIRGFVVAIISAVLSGVAGGGPPFARALAFLTGIFPETGLQYLRNIAKVAAGQQGAEPRAGFRSLPEVDADAEAALAEVGVASAQELALTDWESLLERVGIAPRSLMMVADRALLLLRISVEKAKELEIAIPGLTTASAVVLYALGRDAYSGGPGPKLPNDPTLARPLDEGQKATRRENLIAALGAIDVDELVSDFAQSRNVAFVIDNLRRYGRS